MRANNETGVIQDVARAAPLVHAAGALLHVDAVQAAGKIPLDFVELGADLMSLSSHKLYGPKGIGALIVGGDVDLAPLHHGGAQERGRRGGTENVAAIVGFGRAAELAVQELEARAAQVLALRDRLEAGLRAWPRVRIFADGVERIANTVQFGLDGYDGEALLMQLDRKGFAVSSGSACASGKGEPSHVLLGMGIARDIAKGAVRISFGKDNTAEEVDQFLEVLRTFAAGAA
jgi:cysteine desulfurase